MEPHRLCIRSSRSHPTLEFAVRECRAFLESTTSFELVDDGDESDFFFSFAVDRTLLPTEYSYGVEGGKRRAIELKGYDETCVLHALYAFFENLGFYFDILGPIAPDNVVLSGLKNGKTIVTPFVKKRGIRQHINFAMDISSYPLAEAQEYIRNLARMKMNHITFHSYNGQWFGYAKEGTYQAGGKFFYGTRLDIPQKEPFNRIIRNRSIFSIPEIEAVLDHPADRERMAAEWLNSVIGECKRVGMHVQFSIEPAGETLEEGIAACRKVLELYPLIDTLELITPECGDSKRTLNVDEIKAILSDSFNMDALDPSLLESIKPGLDQLEGGLRYCGRNLRLIDALRADEDLSFPKLVLGAYITCPDTLKILHALMQKNAPPDVALSFLPAHGSRRSVGNLRKMDFTRESIGRSLLYSWIEFDGNMYLQQNSVTGTRQLLEFAKEMTGKEQVAGIALNHWRTAENRFCIGYAAEALVSGPIDPKLFYKRSAKAFGIADAQLFAAIMGELDELDDLGREKMFNIGFCATSCWIRPGLRWTKRWDDPTIDQCRSRYIRVAAQLKECLQSAETPMGRKALRFLLNRVECTVLHLYCAQTMKSLAAFCDHDKPDALSSEQKRKVVEACAAATAYAEAYKAKHAEAILDRGCEGTLISYQTVIPNFIEHIKAVFTEGEVECTHYLPEFDAPPPPMTD